MNKTSIKEVDVIAPCYNEEMLISAFYNEVMKCAMSETSYTFHIIFIDDGSTDNTLKEIKKLESKHQNVSFISFSRNFGKESAMFAGLEYAGGDYVTIMDVDLQDKPELLNKMLREMEAGADCCGVRRKNRKGELLLRSLFSKLFYKIMNCLSDVKIVDGARDFRMMTRQMVEAILQLREKERFSKGIFMWVGFHYHWLEYENVQRREGKSKWSLWKLMNYAKSGIVAFSNAPLHIMMGTGALIAVSSLVFMIIKIIKVILYGIDVHGYASTIVLICFFGGLNLFAIGLVGEYLGRVNSEVKNRPLYIVREKKICSIMQESDDEKN